jgi:hypothetical protein
MSRKESSEARRIRGKRANRRGKTSEYKVRDLLRKQGFQAERVPLSGSLQTQKGDLRYAYEKRGEVKQIPSKRLRGMLEGNDALFLDERQEEPLVVVTLTVYSKLLRDSQRLETQQELEEWR